MEVAEEGSILRSNGYILYVGVHCFPLMILFEIISGFITFGHYEISRPLAGSVFAILSFLYYLFTYKKERWEGYIERFKDEEEYGRKKGTFLVRLFTIGSFVLFFLLLPLVRT